MLSYEVKQKGIYNIQFIYSFEKNVLAKYENQVHTLRLPPVDTEVGLEKYLSLLTEDLGCCVHLIRLTPTTCVKCETPLNEPAVNGEKLAAKRKGTYPNEEEYDQVIVILAK